MRTLLAVTGLCAIALLHGCRHAREVAAEREGEGLIEDERSRGGTRALRGEGVSRSEVDRRGARRRDPSGATGKPSGDFLDGPDGLEGTVEDPSEGRWRDRRSSPAGTISDDELLVSLEVRSLPDGVYEVDRSSARFARLTEEEFEELVKRVNERMSWIKVIRVGPWRIRVVRDTFFDPYRRDSGWIDIDQLDGPHGR